MKAWRHIRGCRFMAFFYRGENEHAKQMDGTELLVGMCLVGCCRVPDCRMCAPGRLDGKEPGACPGQFQGGGHRPGDADLLTTRAIEAIREADLVFCSARTWEKLKAYVHFEGKQVLEGYGVLFRYYGKDCSQVSLRKTSRRGMSCKQYHQKQAEFESLVREAVGAGKRVVALGSGDPTIYGPDMWTIKALRDFDPEVVPGLSSFNAASAVLKVPLGEVIITAPFKKAGAKDSIERLARHELATLVIFMPRNMPDLFARLNHVYAADTPAAIVMNAGVSGRQKALLGTVGGVCRRS